MFLRLLIGLLAVVCTCLILRAEAVSQISFSRDIRPILSDTCFQCHGPDEAARQTELRLDTREGLLGDGNAAGVVVAGDVNASALIRRVLAEDPAERMPPPDSKLTLSAAQISLLREWIRTGAPWQQHWSFIAPVRPAVPLAADRAWPINQIDAFVFTQLERAGLQPNGSATKEKLIRRVTLDLTGVPPTIEEMDRFLADESPDSYEKVVDRLLASPRYGERIVWDWLEAARYADTNGFQGDPLRTLWPWRDWAIQALNSNMPYDRFTLQQLAGDLLPDATPDQIIATGFNRNHMHNGEGGRIAEETRVENVFDRLETTATVWLGLTMNCCRCHDHKFDPLHQSEYYQFFAFFNNTSEEGGNSRPVNIDPVVPVPTAEQSKQLAEFGEHIKNLAGQLTIAESGQFNGNSAIPEAVEKLLEKKPDERSEEDLQQLFDHFHEQSADYAQLLAELKSALEARRQLNTEIPTTMVMDSLEMPRETFILDRGLYNKPLSPVSAGVPEVLPPLPAGAPADRLALAQWLVSDEHPLTARVTVNRFWQMIFGKGLVGTPDDFGVQGERPSHPDLLDWLATELMHRQWNVKGLHKLMVTCATYRQSAHVDSFAAEIDPDNRWLSHAPRHRMPAWMIRDSALVASGLLVDIEGGPPVKPYQPAGVWREASFGRINYEQDHGEKLYRRSLYTFWRRIVGPTMFFDVAKRQTCSVKPSLTNTPLHALITLNDVTFVEAARVLAERIMQDSDEPSQRITAAFRRTTSRQPKPREIDVLLRRFEILKSEYAAVDEAAQQLVQTGEFPRDEALDTMEHAAYSSICLMLLNLDEALTK